MTPCIVLKDCVEAELAVTVENAGDPLVLEVVVDMVVDPPTSDPRLAVEAVVDVEVPVV